MEGNARDAQIDLTCLECATWNQVGEGIAVNAMCNGIRADSTLGYEHVTGDSLRVACGHSAYPCQRASSSDHT